jgi:hypothetical protein
MYSGYKTDGSTINMADLMESQVGGKGAEFISDTATHTATGLYVSLQVINEAVISAYTTDVDAPITGNDLKGSVLPMGTIIYGRFKSIALTSGKILAYKGI